MSLSELSPSPGSRSPRRRVGRGNASGTGTTAGKGTKGQKARSGGINAFYRGISSRMQRYGKLPGFHNRWRVEYVTVNLSDLERFDKDSIIDAGSLRAAGLMRGKKDRPVKLLGQGELSKPLVIKLDKISKAAREKVEAAGGRVEEQGDDSGSA